MKKRLLFVTLLFAAGLLQANPVPSSSLELWFNEEDKSVEMYYHLLQDYNYDSETGESSDWDNLPVTHAIRLKCDITCRMENSVIESAYELRTDNPLVSSCDPCVAPGEYHYVALDNFPLGYYSDYGTRFAGISIPGTHSCPESGIKLCMSEEKLRKIISSGPSAAENLVYCNDDDPAISDTDEAVPDTEENSHSSSGCSIVTI